MRVMYVDVALTGHHIPYLKALINNKDYESYAILPDTINGLNCNQVVLKEVDYTSRPRKLLEHVKFLDNIKSIADKNKVDIIHFLCGDVMYRFFGIGLSKLKDYKIIVTIHHIYKNSFLYMLGIKQIFKKIDVGIVHTEIVRNELSLMRIKNICHIEYPNFNNNFIIDKEYARRSLDLPENTIVLGAIGGTRIDKGLDILLDSLNGVNVPFFLLIAGLEQDVTIDCINSKIKNYKNSVKLIMRYLTDEELIACVAASDIIILPYRKIFNAASGPLAEGVWNKKIIVGPNHGSLGDIIRRNKLGFTFESENKEDLARVITQAINSRYEWNIDAERYREYLKPERFVKDHKDAYGSLVTM